GLRAATHVSAAGAHPAGRPPRRRNQQIVRRAQRGMAFPGAVAPPGALADVGPFAPAYLRAFVQELSDLKLAPAGGLDVLAQLLGDYDRVVAAVDRIVALVGSHLRRERLENLLRVSGPLVHD